MKNKELKKLNEILTKGGPSYAKVKIELEKWLEAYEKRNQIGDINVIKFIEYLCNDKRNN